MRRAVCTATREECAIGAPALASCLTGAPTLGIGLASHLGVRNGTHDGTDFDLLMRFDGRFLGAAALFAPDHFYLVSDLDVGVHGGERQHGALVVAATREHREPDELVAYHQAVVIRRRIVRQR